MVGDWTLDLVENRTRVMRARHGGSPRLSGAYIGVVGEDRPSLQRGAFAWLA
jgi:hypothetical protein